jgi:hypothetical protein
MWVHSRLVMLSHAVLSRRTTISIFMMLSLACVSVQSVGLPFIVMWGDRGEVRCYGLSKVWNGGEGCDLHGLWLVLLESAKDWLLGVEPPGQHVPPRVRYGMTCLLIRDAVESVPCSDEWEVLWSFAQAHMVQEGPWYIVQPQETLALLWYHILP